MLWSAAPELFSNLSEGNKTSVHIEATGNLFVSKKKYFRVKNLKKRCSQKKKKWQGPSSTPLLFNTSKCYLRTF